MSITKRSTQFRTWWRRAAHDSRKALSHVVRFVDSVDTDMSVSRVYIRAKKRGPRSSWLKTNLQPQTGIFLYDSPHSLSRHTSFNCGEAQRGGPRGATYFVQNSDQAQLPSWGFRFFLSCDACLGLIFSFNSRFRFFP